MAQPQKFSPADSQPDSLPLPDRIAAQLASDINSGSFAPGAPVREQELATRFATSRGPIREALRILERDQLVTMPPRRSARVVKLSRAEIADAFDVRSALFGLAVKNAAARIPEERVEDICTSMRTVADAIEQGGPPDETGAAVCDELLTLSQNQRAQAILAPLQRQCRLQCTAEGPVARQLRSQLVATWRGFADAFEVGDPNTLQHIADKLITLLHSVAVACLDRE